MPQAKRIADRKHNVARVRFIAVGKCDRGQIFLFDFQQRHVRARVGADFLRLIFAEVRAEPNHELIRAGNDVVGSENVSVRANDHA